MQKEIDIKEIPITVETAKKDVPKTGPEKKLRTKYNKLLKQMETFEELQQLANDFKADLKVFLQKNRRYSFMILLFVNMSFGQNSIVGAGNQNETFGANLVKMQEFDTIINEVSLGVPKYEYPEQPKPIIKKKPKSFFKKIIEFFKNLINKNK